MKRKILLSVFIIFLVLALVGCGVILNISQKEEIKEVVVNYWSALSNKQYELAKTYCMLYGDIYYAVEEYQNLLDYFDYDYITLNWTPYINWVKIIGNKAIVDMDITLVSTVCFEDICSSESETVYNYSMYLIKIDGDWKFE